MYSMKPSTNQFHRNYALTALEPNASDQGAGEFFGISVTKEIIDLVALTMSQETGRSKYLCKKELSAMVCHQTMDVDAFLTRVTTYINLINSESRRNPIPSCIIWD